ncbi:MAG: universal stress protein [Planctomycetes bacterium]|nr:universal stress protein [Planctomycetota bacterium]
MFERIAIPLDGSERAERILVPLDGSENSLAIAPTVEEWARLFDSEILVLRVAEEDAGASPEAEIEGVLERFRALRLKSRSVIRKGDSAACILDAAEDECVDLIAMAAHGRSGVSRWVFGSVTERVLRQAGQPLLIVRSQPLSAVRLTPR